MKRKERNSSFTYTQFSPFSTYTITFVKQETYIKPDEKKKDTINLNDII